MSARRILLSLSRRRGDPYSRFRDEQAFTASQLSRWSQFCANLDNVCHLRVVKPLWTLQHFSSTKAWPELITTCDEPDEGEESKWAKQTKKKRAHVSHSLGDNESFLYNQSESQISENVFGSSAGLEQEFMSDSCPEVQSSRQNSSSFSEKTCSVGKAMNVDAGSLRKSVKSDRPAWGSKPRGHHDSCDQMAAVDCTRGRRSASEMEGLPEIDLSDPKEVFHSLLANSSAVLTKAEKDKLAGVFRHFREGGWAVEQASSRLYVSSVVFPTAVARFRKFFMFKCTSAIRSHLMALGPTSQGDQFLFPLFSDFCTREFPTEIVRYRALVETTDLTKPHTWFPFARAMKRKIIYHAGPTNSGKTYNALARFKEAPSGVYCSPLRLLAMEVYDGVNASGVYCSLFTGQEKKEVPFANHVACTVEMVPTQKPWDVAVIDEIQMLTDDFRGWAWTRAFLGLLADEVHVCGDPSVLPLVRDMCAVTGDELEEHFYDRFEPLSVDEDSLQGKYTRIQPGDCIVSFSRKEIFSIKRAVELATANRCCVVYGALPPETRSHQAKLFNDAESGYDVLVATDAVGMGLNLNIRRVIFYTLEKYNGETMVKVSPSQVKQIAGRAGRRGTIYPLGSVTTFYSQDMPYLTRCLNEPFVESHSAGLFPSYEQIEIFANQLPDATFSKLLDRFSETCQVDGSYFLCRNDNLKKVAGIIDKVKGLTLEDKMKFILAPVNTRDQKVVGALFSFAMAYSQRLPVHLNMVAPTRSAKSDIQLMDLEARHQVLSLYLWLSHHFSEEYFPHKEQAETIASEIALLLGESLVQTNTRIMLTGRQGLVRKRAQNSQKKLTRPGRISTSQHSEQW